MMYSFICLETCFKNMKPISINNVLQGGSKQVRFQPVHGKFIATATGNIPKLIDVQTAKVVCNLKVT